MTDYVLHIDLISDQAEAILAGLRKGAENAGGNLVISGHGVVLTLPDDVQRISVTLPIELLRDIRETQLLSLSVRELKPALTM